MKYAVSNEGVQELNKMAGSVSEAIQQLDALNQKMVGVAEEYSGTIGPHQSELTDALQEIANSVKQASEPANNVSTVLTSVAQKYEAIIAKQPFNK